MTLAKHLACLECGYDLHGIPEVRCPECGFHYDAKALVWVATVQGKGTAMNGNNFTLHNQVRKQVQGAINDLFAKSHAAISRSPEIKAFVRARNSGHASGRSGDDN